jgi:hypothetical protein
MFYHGNSAYRANLPSCPSLYLCRAQNMMGHVPMMPCFHQVNLWVEAARLHCTIAKELYDEPVSNISMGRGNKKRLYELNLLGVAVWQGSAMPYDCH